MSQADAVRFCLFDLKAIGVGSKSELTNNKSFKRQKPVKNVEGCFCFNRPPKKASNAIRCRLERKEIVLRLY